MERIVREGVFLDIGDFLFVAGTSYEPNFDWDWYQYSGDTSILYDNEDEDEAYDYFDSNNEVQYYIYEGISAGSTYINATW